MAQLPEDLQRLGNVDAWQRVITLLNDNAKAVLVSGPIGCGKSKGLESLLSFRGFRCILVDVTDVSSTSDFGNLLRNTCVSVNTREESCAYVLDLEGFLKIEGTNVEYRTALCLFLEARRRQDAPLFLEVNNPYDLSLGPDLRKLCAVVRMTAPTREHCMAFFPSKKNYDRKGNVYYYPREWVEEFSQARDNDLRQVDLALQRTQILRRLRKFQVNKGLRKKGDFVLADELKWIATSSTDRSASFFNATDTLARARDGDAAERAAAVDKWVRHCGDTVERVVHSNAHARAQEAIDQKQLPCPTCDKPLALLSVKKEGPNKGKWFLRCNHACDKWVGWATAADREAMAAPGKATENDLECMAEAADVLSSTDAYPTDYTARAGVVPFRAQALGGALLTHVPPVARAPAGQLKPYPKPRPPPHNNLKRLLDMPSSLMSDAERGAMYVMGGRFVVVDFLSSNVAADAARAMTDAGLVGATVFGLDQIPDACGHLGAGWACRLRRLGAHFADFFTLEMAREINNIDYIAGQNALLDHSTTTWLEVAQIQRLVTLQNPDGAGSSPAWLDGPGPINAWRANFARTLHQKDGTVHIMVVNTVEADALTDVASGRHWFVVAWRVGT